MSKVIQLTLSQWRRLMATAKYHASRNVLVEAILTELDVCVIKHFTKTIDEDKEMPAKSKAQQQAMAIAEHEPKKLYKRNKGLKKMTKQQLHDFAATKTKKLPKKVKKGR